MHRAASLHLDLPHGVARPQVDGAAGVEWAGGRDDGVLAGHLTHELAVDDLPRGARSVDAVVRHERVGPRDWDVVDCVAPGVRRTRQEVQHISDPCVIQATGDLELCSRESCDSVAHARPGVVEGRRDGHVARRIRGHLAETVDRSHRRLRRCPSEARLGAPGAVGMKRRRTMPYRRPCIQRPRVGADLDAGYSRPGNRDGNRHRRGFPRAFGGEDHRHHDLIVSCDTADHVSVQRYKRSSSTCLSKPARHGQGTPGCRKTGCHLELSPLGVQRCHRQGNGVAGLDSDVRRGGDEACDTLARPQYLFPDPSLGQCRRDRHPREDARQQDAAISWGHGWTAPLLWSIAINTPRRHRSLRRPGAVGLRNAKFVVRRPWLARATGVPAPAPSPKPCNQEWIDR